MDSMKLSNEELENVNGGYKYCDEETGLWYIIDVNTGKAIAAYDTYEECKNNHSDTKYGMGTVSEGIVEHLRAVYGLTKEEQFADYVYYGKK